MLNEYGYPTLDDYAQSLTISAGNDKVNVYDVSQVGDIENNPRAPHNSREKALEELHILFPFLEIDPPGNNASLVVLAQNVAQEIRIPSGMRMMQIGVKSGAEVLWSFGNISTFPTATMQESGISLVNDGRWIYCKDMSSIFLISSAAAVVGVRFFSQL